MGMQHLTVSLFLLALLIVEPSLSAVAAEKKPEPLYIIERDTLQTRNFIPIINHQTMVVNLGETPVSLKITSSFPKNMYKKGDGYPAFLDDSLIADPLFSPLEIVPKKTTYLAQPEISMGAGDVSYLWQKVVLPPGESVVSQYDNYYGEQGYFWRDDGFDFHGIKVKTDYTVRTEPKGRTELSLSFEIINMTGQAVQDFGLGVFVPVRQLLKDRENGILKLEKICTSPNVEATRLTKSDGFGEAAEGVGAGINVKELLPGKPEKFFFCLSGIPAKQAVKSWPILTVTGRSIRPAIWPSTSVIPDKSVNEGRFSYLAYNLVIKDRQLFQLTSDGAKVKSAKPK